MIRFFYTKTFIRLFVLFACIALLIILDQTGILGIGKTAFVKTYGAAANKSASAASSIKELFAVFFTIKNLVSENSVLNQKIDELSFENARLQSAKIENSALRRALNFEEISDFTTVPVEVLTSDPTGFSQIITVNKGSAAELTEGSAVIAAPGLLVGKVSRVFNSYSEVTLITDPSILVNAEVAESGATGLVRGEHGLALTFGLVTQNEVIKVQDRVVTSGSSGDFPKGLLIGEIFSVRSGQSQLFQEAFISPAADLKRLKFLFVVK
ncbi:MAG: rod shape-determining protein MreC [Candidatus Doudnabacteria bacterium]|nr:rod shape-determining protein MreC [Candidatus Doudnabacteria bacterium]